MKWEIHTIEKYPGDLWGDWDKLNAEYCDSHPMLQSVFVKKLIEYFPAEIEALCGFNGFRCLAIILLKAESGIIKTAYIPSQSQIALLLAPPNINRYFDIKQLNFSSIVTRLDMLSIDPEYQPGIIDIEGLEIAPNKTDAVIDVTSSFEDYWSKRPKNLRKNISRYKNRVSRELRDYTFKVVCGKDMDEVRIAVDRYGLMESRGWKGKHGSAVHPGNAQGQFYLDIITHFASSHRAYVFELWAQNKLMASRLCICSDSLLIVLKTTYDEEYKQYAFGRLLLYETVKYVFDKQITQKIDFYTNATKEQLDWATGSRQIYMGSLYFGRTGSLLRFLIRIKNLIYREKNGRQRS